MSEILKKNSNDNHDLLMKRIDDVLKHNNRFLYRLYNNDNDNNNNNKNNDKWSNMIL